MGYRFLDHATDVIVEVTAPDLEEAFVLAGQAVVEITLESSRVRDTAQKRTTVRGKDLRYLLFNWLEEIVYQLITEGFAICRFDVDIIKSDSGYVLESALYGEPLDLDRHHFKTEIKAPTFHEMEISVDGKVTMRCLLDL